MALTKSRTSEALEAARKEVLDIYEAGAFPQTAEATRYLQTHIARYRHDVTEVANRLAPGDEVLDLGAAPFCTSQAYHRLGFCVTAADLCPTFWLNPDALPYPVVEVDCDGKTLPFPDESFAAVVFTEIFEHLHVNLNYTMKEILRVLKPNGFLYLTTPNMSGLRNMFRFVRHGKCPGDVYHNWAGAEIGQMLGHVREYTAQEVACYLPKCGYANVEVTSRNVYEKGWLATNLWKAITYPFPNGKETIVAIARRAA